MHDFNRADRVGDTIQRELSVLIQTEIGDPRLGMVNVNAVRVTPELRNARVYVTFVDTHEAKDIKQGVAILNKASGFLRSKLHTRMTLRVMPKLHFEFDESIERAAHMTKLIDSVAPAPDDSADDGEQSDR